MTKRSVLPLGAALIGALLLSPAVIADGDPEAGRHKADTCLGCHGVDGADNVYPSYKVPKLGGQHPEYIVSALKAYQAGERDHPTMEAQATPLSDEDMEDIAAWFGSLEGPR